MKTFERMQFKAAEKKVRVKKHPRNKTASYTITRAFLLVFT